MIVETIIGSLTTITCTSVWAANAMDRRRHNQEHPTILPKVKLLPFENPYGNKCRLCGNDGKLVVATFCRAKTCAAGPHPHLDMSCSSCRGKYYKLPQTIITE